MASSKRTKATKARTPRKAAKSGTKTKAASKAPTKRAKAKSVAKPEKAERGARPRDPRLPAAGTVLVRPYKGKDFRITVLQDGFRWDGNEYRSLSALAQVITGATSINGFLWARLTEPRKPATKPASRPRAAKPKAKRGKGAAAATAEHRATQGATEPATA